MGLDGVELIMEMEETFGIVVDDRDAQAIGTVGQAYRYILSKLKLKQSTPCPSAALFYRLRRALMDASGADRGTIRPASRLDDLLPSRTRRTAWRGLAEELGVALPPLGLDPVQSRWAIGLGIATAAAALAAGTALDGLSAGNLAPAVAATALAAGMGWAAADRALSPFASTLPPGCETVRGTVLAALGRHRRSPVADSKSWQPDEVWAALRELISEQLGVARDQVTEDKSFVDDFGMD